MKNIQDYLKELNRTYQRGNATEHTYRPVLKTFIESLAKGITVTNEPTRIKCGAPDYMISRRKRHIDQTIGYIEAKDVGANLGQIVKTEQVKRYLPSLHNFILTDYIEFRWYVGAEHRMTVRLAEESGGKFVATEASIASTVEVLRSFLSQEVERIAGARLLAERMAAIARLLRSMTEKTFEGEVEQGPLHSQLAAFRQVLLHDLEEKQFADMYAQTICYGLFAASCFIEDINLFGKDKYAVFHGMDFKRGEFTREHAAGLLPKTNPFLQKLFYHIAGPDLPDEIAWLVDDLVMLLKNCQMDKVLRGFAKESKRKDPVIHFYETFLAEYDPKMREMRGVYYTPESVVGYIVRSVEYILKTRFGLKKGLADNSKIRIKVERDKKKGKGKTTEWKEFHKLLILDPAAGTGTFLHEVIAEAHKKFVRNKGLWPGYVKDHLLPRLYGFELMMAPYAIAHMKLGLQLAESGYDFASDERLRIFLTNTLEEAEEMSNLPLFTQWLTEEARRANEVKKELPIMVVLGNPPYSVSSQNKSDFIEDLIKTYKSGVKEEKNIQPLSDDYIKFIRFAHAKIEKMGIGVVAMITNNSYIDGLIHRGMREELLKTFNEIYILDLHGNRMEEFDVVDKNVFDINQGVAISIMVKNNGSKSKSVFHYDLIGERNFKYEYLRDNSAKTTTWDEIIPSKPEYFFVPIDLNNKEDYQKHTKVNSLFPECSRGIETGKDEHLVTLESEDIKKVIYDLIDSNISMAFIAEKYGIRNTSGWNVTKLRSELQNEGYDSNNLQPICYRPFDNRYTYFSNILRRSQKRIMRHLTFPNIALIVIRQVVGPNDYTHFLIAKDLVDNRVFISNRSAPITIPLYLYPPEAEQNLFDGDELSEGKDGRRANLDGGFVEELAGKVKMEYIDDGRGDLGRNAGVPPARGDEEGFNIAGQRPALQSGGVHIAGQRPALQSGGVHIAGQRPALQ